MPEIVNAGGDGKNGKLNVLNATGDPVFEVNVGGPNPRVLTSQLRLGAKELPGFLALEDGEDDVTATIDGKNGHLTMGGRSKGGRGSNGSITLNDRDGAGSVQINAGSDGADVFLGEANKPGRIQVTTGGNPGPTITVDGPKNSLMFYRKGSNTDAVVEVNGAGRVNVGGYGATGSLQLRAGAATDAIVELTGNGMVRAGGAGVNGVVSVRGADGMPLAELLAFPGEGVLGLGQANRPGRISLFGPKGEAVRIDGASGDLTLFNADCAEEFDLADDDELTPGTVMVLDDDGNLTSSTQAYDTRVVGVVSGAGTYRPALVLDRRHTGRVRAPIALMGKVFCRVDADLAPVGVGDLLTTAEAPGHAMRITDRSRSFGAVLGKALGSLRSGSGLVPVLVALQ